MCSVGTTRYLAFRIREAKFAPKLAVDEQGLALSSGSRPTDNLYMKRRKPQKYAAWRKRQYVQHLEARPRCRNVLGTWYSSIILRPVRHTSYLLLTHNSNLRNTWSWTLTDSSKFKALFDHSRYVLMWVAWVGVVLHEPVILG